MRINDTPNSGGAERAPHQSEEDPEDIKDGL